MTAEALGAPEEHRARLADLAARIETAKIERDTARARTDALRWVRDYADSRASGQVTSEVAKAALEMAGVDGLGLDSQDRKIRFSLPIVRLGCRDNVLPFDIFGRAEEPLIPRKPNMS